jgi:hypothetical protein
MRIVPLVALAALGTQTLDAQSLEQRIASARGSVAFEFTTDANVCGNGSSIYISDDGTVGYAMSSRRSGIHMGRSSAGDTSICESAPGRVVITKAGGEVENLTVSVGGRVSRADTELGAVSAGDAMRYLIALAPKLERHAADNALLGAAIADGPLPWKGMLQIARDNGASEPARKSALFWVSHEASSVATAGLRDVAMDDDANAKVRSDALFYLAQRKNGEGIPGLIKVVEESKSAKMKKDAIFYLSQSRDSRALDLFEKLLAGR